MNPILQPRGSSPDHAAPEHASSIMPEPERLALFRKKAELEVAIGINVQPGQPVLIRAETGHKPYVDLLVECCKARGCGWIEFDWDDVRAQRELLLKGSTAEISRVRPEMVALYERWHREGGARIAIDGDEFPGLLEDIDPAKRALFNEARSTERNLYYNHVAAYDLSQWVVVTFPMPAWADRVFPELPPAGRYDALVRSLAHCMRLNESNPVEAWRSHLGGLDDRAKHLTSLGIRELHFTGPDTDLSVALSPLSVFKGGGGVAKNGVPFYANLPTEEVYTTPDWRGTNGKVRITRPVVINDSLVSGLQLEFRGGILVKSSAVSGHDAFLAHVNIEEGARRLGEVALVGTDSRIYQTGRVFQSTLLDENAASHIAIGNAYVNCLEGGEKMNKEQLAAAGCNNSPKVHSDIMISDDKVDVTARMADGKTIPLLRSGAWVL